MASELEYRKSPFLMGSDDELLLSGLSIAGVFSSVFNIRANATDRIITATKMIAIIIISLRELSDKGVATFLLMIVHTFSKSFL